MAGRLQAMGQPNYANRFELTLHQHMLYHPLQWKQPKKIFVNSMSDLFHKDVPIEFIQNVFDVMRRASWHQFQVLTKRSARLLELNTQISWPPNVWMGVSVENQDYSFRIHDLQQIDAQIKFLSLEPLLGPLSNLDLTKIDWVIVGGESGPKARPMAEDWAIAIRDQCITSGIPFFFKQWGGINKSKTGRVLQGRTWDEVPSPSEQQLSLPFA